MADSKPNRLARLFGDFTNKFELPGKVDPNGLDAELGIPYDGKLITNNVTFDPSDDSYEYVSAFGKVNKDDIQDVNSKLMNSDPIRGNTERLKKDGKYIVYGSRDGLKNISDADIQKGFMDDVYRVTKSYDLFNELTKKKK